MSALQRCVINKISLTQKEYLHKLQQPGKLRVNKRGWPITDEAFSWKDKFQEQIMIFGCEEKSVSHKWLNSR